MLSRTGQVMYQCSLAQKGTFKICSLLVGRKGSYLLRVEAAGMFRLGKRHFQKEAAGEAGTHGGITKTQRPNSRVGVDPLLVRR